MGWLSLLAVVALITDRSGPVAQVSALLGSMARVSHAAADVVESGASLIGNSTAAVSLVAASATATTLGIMSESWRGVDLLNISVELKHGAIMSFDGSDLQAWARHFARQLEDVLPPEAVRSLIDDAHMTGIAYPLTAKADQSLQAQGSYVEWVYELRLLPSGYVGAQWSATRARFEPRWSNPLWELLEVPIESEAAQVLLRLQAALNATPAPTKAWFAWEEEPKVTTAVVHPVSARSRFYTRRLVMHILQYANWLIEWLTYSL